MPQYTNIIKRRTHVTREEALICLSVNGEEFDRYCVLTDTHPYINSKDKLTNKSTRVQYTLTDIHRIRESEPYKKMKMKKENARKRDVYARRGQLYKLEHLREEKIDYGKILLSKYPSFEDVYEDLGEALTVLILAERLIRNRSRLLRGFEVNIYKKICRELSLFYLYLMAVQPEYKVFLSKEGIYYSTEVCGNEVFWKEAYPLADPEDALGINYNVIVQTAEFNAYLLEKVNFRLYKALGDAHVECLREVRRRHSDAKEGDAPQKAENTAEEKDGEEAPARYKAPVRSLQCEDDTREEFVREMDTGEFGGFNLLDMHREMPACSRAGLFKGSVFYICSSVGTIMHSIRMLVVSGGGRVARTEEESTIYICKTVPSNFRVEYNYAHPQIVYDSLNANLLQDVSKYRPGKEIVPHVCPYKSMLDVTDLDTFNLSQRKRQEIESLVNHRK
ncbi:pescadillo [Nematocida major]|uniref:pescadillo n=1 Tax=Nematocida major TaxID=1912982 RepID=UPI00200760D3|nr:pescadillo [Nematocida major]KAH9385593.1 pescadillo [Nematocida major]